MRKDYSFVKADYVGADLKLHRGELGVNLSRFHLGRQGRLAVELGPDRLVFPALINVHDHLRGDYLPRVGPPPGSFYLNWSFWDNDLKSSPVYGERAAISLLDSYLLGAYKNLVSGVVTVNDHFPHEFNAPFLKHLPIRAVDAYTLAHECSSYDLKWGDGIEIEHQRALGRNHPFITHLEEGYDEEAQSGVQVLQTLGSLDDHTVMIHCIGFSDADIQTVKKAGAHVVWCPASNMFMFNLTCKIKKFLRKGVSVSIGTDSTHTGSANLLEEMRFGRYLYQKLYSEDLPPKEVYRMVTVNPAAALRMEDRVGRIEEGFWADVLVAKRKADDPFNSLLDTGLTDIELVVKEGTPLYGATEFADLFAERSADARDVVVDGKPMLVRGDPAGLLRRVHEAVGFAKKLDFLPVTL